MRQSTRWVMMCAAVVAAATVGCGKSDANRTAAGDPQNSGGEQVADSADASATAKPDGPAAALTVFLDAVRTGDDAKATQMLSTVARQKASELNRSVRPSASDTARFKLGQVELLGDDGARVSCTWTDVDENGQPQSDDALWVLRREGEGWRVAGVAATIFPGEPPLLLDFEKPEDMEQKQQWVREEVLRRSQQTELRAQGGEKSEKPVMR